jgi:predicted nucleic acid-binding protein
MAVFLDSNVFLYAAMRGLKPRDKPKRPLAQALIDADDFVISVQVLGEFYDNIRRKGPAPFSHDEAVEWIDLMQSRSCVDFDLDLVSDATRIADRYQIRYWDSAIIAAAHQLGATTLYTEDLNDGQTYGSVTVINPFKSIPN